MLSAQPLGIPSAIGLCNRFKLITIYLILSSLYCPNYSFLAFKQLPMLCIFTIFDSFLILDAFILKIDLQQKLAHL